MSDVLSTNENTSVHIMSESETTSASNWKEKQFRDFEVEKQYNVWVIDFGCKNYINEKKIEDSKNTLDLSK